jgi:hypothetical protein
MRAPARAAVKEVSSTAVEGPVVSLSGEAEEAEENGLEQGELISRSS